MKYLQVSDLDSSSDSDGEKNKQETVGGARTREQRIKVIRYVHFIFAGASFDA